MSGLVDARASEITQRFLRAIAERVGAERVAEVHLLPPLRQGPIESAVAVVAVADEGGPPAVEGATRTLEETRHAIYTAAYRYTRKGRDRGAWAVDVVVQADAPLDTVATVVRGVQRRSDGAWAGVQAGPGGAWPEADRLSGADFRALVADVAPDARAAAAAGGEVGRASGMADAPPAMPAPADAGSTGDPEASGAA